MMMLMLRGGGDVPKRAKEKRKRGVGRELYIVGG
jgi:hypothetical protein